MDGVKGIGQYTQTWWQFFDYCFNLDPASSLCTAFWTKAVAGFIALGTLAVLFGAWKYYDYRRKYAQALRAQWEREQVDEAGIAEARWIEDTAYQAELPEDEVLRRIREAVNARRQDVTEAKADGAVGNAP